MADREKRWFDWGLVVVFLLTILIPITYPPMAKIIPMTFGGFGIALILWEIFSSKKVQEDPPEDKKYGDWKIILTWLALLGVLIYFLGIMITIPIYTLLFLRFKGGDEWVPSIINSAISGVAFYVVFVFALNANLYKGLIWLTLRRYW